MSKAFTREDGEGASLEAVVPALARGAAGETRYLTPEGAAALREELARLTRERSALRADNGQVGSPRDREVELRLQRVAEVLDAAVVAPVEADARGRALFGAWVVTEDEDGARRTFRLVGPDEADARAGRISASSPLGRALIGKRAGDEVTVELPKGASTIEVVSVSYAEPRGP
ncbi:MAG: transcription elongation factor GreB [Myxococcales bacterium]